MLGFVLDARIRAATRRREEPGRRDAARVHAVFRVRAASRRRSSATTASEVAGHGSRSWFTRALESTEEIDYRPALEWYGLRARARRRPPVDPPGWLGAKTRVDAGRLIVENVPRGTPAFDAGVNPGDEIVAIDDFRVAADQLDKRLESYKPGDKVTLLVARRDELKRLQVTLGAEPADRWTLAVRPEATPEQRAHLGQWLGGNR